MDTMVEPGSNSVKVTQIARSALPFIWTDLRQFLLAHPRGWSEFTTIEALHQTALAGSLQFWVLAARAELKLVAIGYGELHPIRSTYHIVWCGGTEFRRYGLWGVRAVEQWAQLHGFQELSLAGRKGWSRLLESSGFRQKHVLLTKSILPFGQGHG